MNSFAYLVVAAFLDASPCEPAPCANDLHRFPSKEETEDYLAFNQSQCVQLEAWAAIYPRRSEEFNAIRYQLDEARGAWWDLQTAHHAAEFERSQLPPNDDCENCWSLENAMWQLRGSLSQHDYYAGKLPKPMFYLVNP